MAEKETKKYKQKLLALRGELEALEKASDADEPIKLDQTRVGRLSRMDALQGQQMAKEVARRRQLKLQMISAALGRIEADDYGFCYICHEAINPKRLAVDPCHTRCVDCVDK